MIIWTGFGFLVILFIIAGIGIASLLAALFGTNLDDMPHVFPPLGFFIAAALTYSFQMYVLAKREAPRQVTDHQTGKEMTLKRTSTLFFIPMKIWSYILAAGGVILIFVGLASL